MDADAFRRQLLDWFHRNKRDLPWRRAADPYHILAAEVMLQQTQSASVLPYYERFLKRFPTLQSLAEAPLEEAYRLWQGLGYYARARRLQEAAKMTLDRFDGQIPNTVEELMSLPGVGRYTAGAVASAAYQVPAPVVDGNVMRVLSRVFRVEGNPKAGPSHQRLWDIAESLVPKNVSPNANPRDFNSALMELGSLVCAPKNPRCGQCPVADLCEAQKRGETDRFPENPPRPKTIRLTHAAALVARDGLFALTRRPEGGRWAGLWELPRVERNEEETLEDAAERAALQVCGARCKTLRPFGSLRHSVTRYRIDLHGFRAEWLSGELQPLECREAVWTAPEQLDRFPLSSPQRRLLALALDKPTQALLFS